MRSGCRAFYGALTDWPGIATSFRRMGPAALTALLLAIRLPQGAGRLRQ